MTARLTPVDITHLGEMFARWLHPAVRDPRRAALVGDGRTEDAEAAVQLLVWLVVDAPVAAAYVTDFDRLGDRMLGAIVGLLRAAPAERPRREELSEQLILTLEPLCMKVLALLEPSEFQVLRESKRGLAAAIAALQRRGRIRYELQLSPAEFERTEGWDARSSLDNAVRDLMPARLDAAHRATAPADHVWMSAMAFVLGVVNANAQDLTAVRGTGTGSSPLPANRSAALVGLPSHRQLDVNAAEPLTTRRPVAADWRKRIEADFRESGRVWVVEGTPGWGKSMFIALTLDGLHVPIHFVDASLCATEHDLAEALLSGIELDDEARATIDRRPVSAVRLLSHWLSGRAAVIVFENLHRNTGAQPPPGLERFVRALHEFGYLVVLESWTPELECLRQLPHGKVRRCSTNDLPRLSTIEIQEWAGRLLGRALSEREVGAVELFEGHPMATRGVLEMLRLRHPEPAADVEVDVLDTCYQWRAVQDTFAALIARQLSGGSAPPSGTANLTLDDELAAWFGVLPFATPNRDDLPEGLRRAVPRLRAIGLVDFDGPRCETEAWGRIIGTQRCQDRPDLVAGVEEWLMSLAACVPEASRERQRRHLAVMASALPTCRETLRRVLNAVPVPSADDTLRRAAEPVAPYSAPAPPAAIDVSLSVTPSSPPLGSAEAAALLPADIFFWLFEAAGRHSNAVLVERQLNQLRAGAASDWTNELHSSWWAVRAMHRAIAQLSVPQRHKWTLSAIACELLPPDLGAVRLSPAYRGWAARLLTASAEHALAAGEASRAEECLARAERALEGATPTAGDEYAQYLHDDIVYRIAAARAAASPSLAALVEAHIRALRAIPSQSKWSPERHRAWTLRELRHLQPLAMAHQFTDELVERSHAALGRLDSDAYWFRTVDRICRHCPDTPIATRLRRLAYQRLNEIEGGHPQRTVSLARFARLVLEPEESRPHALEWGLHAADRFASLGEDEDLTTAARALSVLSRPRFDGASPDSVEPLAASMLSALDARRADASYDDRIRERVRGTCLSSLALDIVKDDTRAPADADEFDVDRALIRLRRVTRRVEALYRRHTGPRGPWLWDDWAEWKIALSRRVFNLERRRAHPDLEGLSHTNELTEFVRTCDASIPGHPASHAVAVRIYRYLWDWSSARVRIPALAAWTSDFGERARVVGIVVDALSAIALAPALIRAHDRQLDEHEIVLLRRALGESVLSASTAGGQQWAELMRSGLGREADETYWTEVVSAGHRLFGRPEEYWRRVVDYTQTALPSIRAVADELTDIDVLVASARLFRSGAGQPAIGRELRLALAELAITSSLAVDAWQRSTGGRSHFLSAWHIGVSIGLGLSVSTNGTLFGTDNAPNLDRNGRPRTWYAWMDIQLGGAYSSAAGRFRTHCRAVWSQLRELTGGKLLR